MLCLFLSSCSVKEDRLRCPCRLVIGFDESIESSELSVSVHSAGETVFEDVLHPALLDSRVLLVPRNVVSVISYDPLSELCQDAEIYLIEPGKQCDSIYCGVTIVDCRGDEASAVVSAGKQFATVYLNVIASGSSPTLPESVLVSGDICGLNLATLLPVRGEFFYNTDLDEYRSCSFRVPRQQDSRLSLELSGNTGSTGSIDIGRIISNSGYDWSAESLPDILLDISLAELEAGLIVSDWNVKVVESDFQ